MTKEKIKKIGIIVRTGKPQAITTCDEVARWLGDKGCEVFVETRLGVVIKHAKFVRPEDLASRVDAILVLGGDGTMLHTVKLLNGKEIPLLGVNQGGLGFLTAVTLDEIYPMLEMLLSGTYDVEERMLLSVVVRRGGEPISTHRVLNDVVIKHSMVRLVMLETSINKQYVTTYRADGLIVATPTGSTAYSLSATGPILYPSIHSIIVAPICPFNLTKKPVVIPDYMSVDIRLPDKESRYIMSLDGQTDMELLGGDMIEIKRDPAVVQLVTHESRGYFDILRERLLWEPPDDDKPIR